LRHLTSFWSNPSQWFCEQVLRLRLPDTRANESADSELHWLSPMKQGGVRADILRSALAGRWDTAAMPRPMVAAGTLPPGQLGASWFTRLEGDARPVLDALPAGARTSAALTVIGEDWRLTGVVEGIIDDTRYVVRTGSFSAKHRITAWVEHVVMCAAKQQGADVPGTTLLIFPDSKKEKAVVESLDMVPNASAILDDWIGAMHAARRAPLPFFPVAAEAYRAEVAHNAKHVANAKSRAKVQTPLQKAAVAFTGSSFGAAGDEADPYLQLCFRDALSFDDRVDEFVRLTEMLFKPSLSAVWDQAVTAGDVS
jgi:exonuclease V gamma subunit